MKSAVRTFLPTASWLVSLILWSTLPLQAQSPGRTAAGAMGMVTGGAKGTYYAIGQDIAKEAQSVGVPLEVKESGGSLDNVRRLVSPENAALGIIQSDVMDFLRQGRDAQSLRTAEQLGVMFPLYNEEVHVLARKALTQINDLKGKRVVVGVEGSGNWVTATHILYLLGIEPRERLPLGPPEALDAILDNRADAMFYVVGKPALLFQELPKKDSQAEAAVHFISLLDQRIPRSYEPSTIGPKDYPWFSGTIETVAVKALLVGFDFSAINTPYAQQRCDTLERLGKAIRDRLPELQSKGHRKWQQVNLDADLGPWKRHPCLLPASLRRLPLGPSSKSPR